jgi:hypothetical protein
MAEGNSPSKEVLFKAVGLLVGVALILSYRLFPRSHPASKANASAPQGPTLAPGTTAIMNAFSSATSGVEVESSGTVKEVPKDAAGANHQKFILDLGNGHTLILLHDTDSAPPVPAKVGDTLQFRGQYEWNENGGLIHWTHHDPEMKHEDGWVKLDGKAYR